MRRVFTLIELLCVIAIFAVLVALLLPAVNAGIAKGQQAACMGHLRELGCAFHLYASDSNGFLPARQESENVYVDGGINWAIYLLEYYRDVKILDCPVSPDSAPKNTRESLHLNDGNYGWNFTGTQGGLGPFSSRIRNPGAAYLLFDSGDPCVFRDGAPTWNNLMEELDLDFDSGLEGVNRHRGKVNVCFLDLHGEARDLRRFLSVPNARNTAPWHINWLLLQLTEGNIPFPER